MQNPWNKLASKSPYVIPEDLRVLETIGRSKNFVFDVFPEPFLGSLQKAKIVLLNLNPGFDDDDVASHKRVDFSKSLRKNLKQEPQRYPFYLLNPEFSDAPGYKWWNGKLRELIEKCTQLTVSQSIACIEFFPYHSRKWKGVEIPIPSQKYSVYLVKQAIKQKKPILLMRAKKEWFSCVPELERYPYLLRLNSVQNVSVSRKNVSNGKFDELIRAI